MYKLLFIFALLGLAFAAPAPQPLAPSLIYNTYPAAAPYLPGRVILNPAYANPGFVNPALYPAGPIAYTNY